MPAPSPAAAPAAAASSAPTPAPTAATAAGPAPTPAAGPAPATPKQQTRPKNPYPMRRQRKPSARRYEFKPPAPQNVRTRVGPAGAAEKGGGILLGLVGYALTVRYLDGGWTGVQEWLKAKFLNQPTQPLEGRELGVGPFPGRGSPPPSGRKNPS